MHLYCQGNGKRSESSKLTIVSAPLCHISRTRVFWAIDVDKVVSMKADIARVLDESSLETICSSLKDFVQLTLISSVGVSEKRQPMPILI